MKRNFKIEVLKGQTVITYQDKITNKQIFASKLSKEEADKWVGLLNRAYMYGSTNALFSVKEMI
ncbi:hypothetical protein [Sporosarcina sp. FSL W7-1283]|uniref:hypothetical protein n=1 Tax=Sporosarcina sp. FSL W7-1283 TaxID=2921560 RepID=UPI0030F75EBC